MPEVKYQNLPFKDAIEFFRQKLNLPTRKWTDILDGMHSRAFVVAGAMKSELLADLRAAIDKGLSEGISIQQFRKEFDQIVKKHGWTYRGERGWRTGVIFNTNMRTAYATGRYKHMTDPDVMKVFPYWRYRTKDDSRVRPGHKQWHNVVLPVNHEWWDNHKPPKGWGCRCFVENLSRKEFERLQKKGNIKTKPTDDGTYEWINPNTGKIERIPNGVDPGWNYDIAKSTWGEITAMKEIEKYTGGQWIDVDPIGYTAYNRPEKIPVDIPIASIGTKAKTEAQLRKSFKDAIGEEEVYFTNPFGEKILVSQVIVEHMLENKKRWDGREAYFPFIREVIEKPFEIWFNFTKHKTTGQYGIRERHIKIIKINKNKTVALIATVSNGMLASFTFLDTDYVNNLRMGRLLWGR